MENRYYSDERIERELDVYKNNRNIGIIISVVSIVTYFPLMAFGQVVEDTRMNRNLLTDISASIQAKEKN